MKSQDLLDYRVEHGVFDYLPASVIKSKELGISSEA